MSGISSQVPPVPRLPSLYASSSKTSTHTQSDHRKSSAKPLRLSASCSTLQIYSPTASPTRSKSQTRVPLASASRSTLHPSASRSTLQIYSPTASRASLHTCSLNSSASRSTIQIHSPTASSPSLLHPHSANTSRISVWQSLSPSANFTTSNIALVDLPTAANSTSKLLQLEDDRSSKISFVQPSTSPYAPKRRELSRWPRRLPDLSEIDEHVLALAVTITLAILVLIGVPLGAILPQRYVVQLPVNVIVPFYVRPLPGAWDRLYQAVIKNPDTNFTVIVNIDTGPGGTVWPPGEWIAPIKRLHVSSNVQTIGYIDMDGGKRSKVGVRKDIATYAGWNMSGIAIHGIYFDRTPLQDLDDGQAYLKNMSAAVRHEAGFLEPKMVVYGAGAVPHTNMTNYDADIVVVFEGEYEDLPARADTRGKVKALGGTREDYAYIVHSVPAEVTRGGIRKIVDGLRRDVKWLFVTDQGGDERYEKCSGRWEEFLSLIW